MRVKICGITNTQEALIAISSGADALGFLLGLVYPSNDEITIETARRIISGLPPFISSVLVTHQASTDWVVRTSRAIRCSTVQLHGDFPIENIPALRRAVPHLRVTKVVHVMDQTALDHAERTAPAVDAIHLDTRTESRLGGTGITHDWAISARIVQNSQKPVILSGGLNPENVREAIKVVRPYAVDVNSGVENPDGTKSLEKIASFTRLAKMSTAEGTP